MMQAVKLGGSLANMSSVVARQRLVTASSLVAPEAVMSALLRSLIRLSIATKQLLDKNVICLYTQCCLKFQCHQAQRLQLSQATISKRKLQISSLPCERASRPVTATVYYPPTVAPAMGLSCLLAHPPIRAALSTVHCCFQ
jgi:hypothetical protein